ncbi:hypothetical protein [Bradyrhizobium yuanmingense]|uniref:hypothetical protein n=1 Tax=Bradyrhizobium yuanmingense TaxID=108015 RepID=UPI0005652833|nr:hypothetical protein [Bradyrhizobium yuanmingense]
MLPRPIRMRWIDLNALVVVMWAIALHPDFVSAAFAQDDLSMRAIEAQIDARQRMVVAATQAEGDPRNHPKYSTYEYLARAARSGCLDPIQFDKLVRNFDDSSWGSDHAARMELVFALPPLTRYLLQYPNCLTKEQNQKIKAALQLPRLIFEHGTINHWSMRASSVVLLSQKYPDLVWTDLSSGRHVTAKQAVEELKPLLVSRYLKFFNEGNAEQFSPVYQAINFIAAVNLAEFSSDDELKRLADISATVMLMSLRANSFHGQLVPPLTRANFPQRSGSSALRSRNHLIVQFLLWFYFGEPLVTLEDLKDRIEPFYPIMYAISSWRPPQEVLALNRLIPDEYEITTVTPTFSKWALPTKDYAYGSAYIGHQFAIGVGNGNINPGEYNGSNQFFGILLDGPGIANTIECYHPYWLSNSGPDAWKSDRSSPFQQHWRDGRRGAIIVDIPSADPWPAETRVGWGRLRNLRASDLLKLLQCRIPSEGAEIVQDDHTIFIRKGSVFVGLRILSGDWQLTTINDDSYMRLFKILKINAARTALYFEVGTADRTDWSSFQRQFNSRQVDFDDVGGQVRVEEGRGSRTTISFRLTENSDRTFRSVPLVHGDTASPALEAKYWLASPFLKIGGGRLSLVTDYGRLTIVQRGSQLVLCRNKDQFDCPP